MTIGGKQPVAADAPNSFTDEKVPGCYLDVMMNEWLQIPSNRKPPRTVRLCVLIGLVCLTFLVAMPGIGAVGSSAPVEMGAQTD